MNPLCRCRICCLLALVVTLLLTGCSIKTDGLVPDHPVAVTTRIDSSVEVMPVQGGRASSFGREAYITNAQYRDALYRALSDARLFREVTLDGPADWQLHSEIITISTEGGVSPLYAIVVQYWIVDPASGTEIWRKGINTRHQVKWNEAFAGATRIIRAVEGATKKNLTGLIEALSREAPGL
ncbi:MAG: hypothetical protein KDI82_10100 [Gammaproteobacteria bacterium]|nr:hypothetical protein [Gammaproteobacteria bacterium]